MTDLTVLALEGGPVVLRRAVEADLPALLRLLSDDQLGAHRDGIRDERDEARYLAAFRAIDADPAHLLVVAQALVDAGSQVAGSFQLSFLPGLSRRGSWRAQIEAVRVHDSYRGRGLGSAMMRWAIEAARERGCGLVQLTTDKRRGQAHDFYQRLGFTASHEGMKLQL